MSKSCAHITSLPWRSHPGFSARRPCWTTRGDGGNWQEGAKKDPHFIASETPYFVGRAWLRWPRTRTCPRNLARPSARGTWPRVWFSRTIDGRQPNWVSILKSISPIRLKLLALCGKQNGCSRSQSSMRTFNLQPVTFDQIRSDLCARAHRLHERQARRLRQEGRRDRLPDHARYDQRPAQG